jgi:hypothetical protein
MNIGGRVPSSTVECSLAVRSLCQVGRTCPPFHDNGRARPGYFKVSMLLRAWLRAPVITGGNGTGVATVGRLPSSSLPRKVL